MIRTIRTVTYALLAFASIAAGSGAAQTQSVATALDPNSNALYKHMLALNGALRTYKADVHVDVALKTFPYISPALDGNVYFKRPDKQAVIFDTVPALAAQFKKLYPKVDPPGSWPALYNVAVLGDERGVTTFRLVPRRNGRVEHLDVRVDDGNATTKGYTWTYKDGGFVTFDQSFSTVAGNFLVDKQVGHVELPSYKADVTSNFSGYRLNVTIDDAVFEEK